ncbi:MAG: SixA phosphatase family protein [Spirosomataceae bacterium]
MKRKGTLWILLFLAAFSVQAQSIFVVRHADKAVNQGSNPSLSSKGMEQAQRLKNLLVNKKITHIYSTDTQRTLQTGEPLSSALGISIEKYDASNQTVFIENIKQMKTSVLIIGHSNTIHHLINAFAEEKVLDGPIDERVYEQLYEIKRKGKKPRWSVRNF